MNTVDLLLFELDRSYDVEGWYPGLKEALAGLTAAQASWRPQGEAANTIWETVNHLLYYKERVLEKARGGSPTFPYKDNTQTFGGEGAEDEAAWQATVARLDAVHKGFKEVLAAKTPEEVGEPLGLGGTIAGTLANIFMHDAYHTGQIVQVRKLQGSWPAKKTYE